MPDGPVVAAPVALVEPVAVVLAVPAVELPEDAAPVVDWLPVAPEAVAALAPDLPSALSLLTAAPEGVAAVVFAGAELDFAPVVPVAAPEALVSCAESKETVQKQAAKAATDVTVLRRIMTL